MLFLYNCGLNGCNDCVLFLECTLTLMEKQCICKYFLSMMHDYHNFNNFDVFVVTIENKKG